jgi:hypothetical protein
MITAESLSTEGLTDAVNGAEGGDDVPMVPDPGYTFLANVMAVFCRNTDRNVRGLRQEMAQLREELFSHVNSAPVPPLPTDHSRMQDGGGARPDPMVPRLSQLRQDPVLAKQAAHLVDSLDSSLSGMAANHYAKHGWARCGGGVSPARANAMAPRSCICTREKH